MNQKPLLAFCFTVALLFFTGCGQPLRTSPFGPNGTSNEVNYQVTNGVFSAVYAGAYGQPGTAPGLFFSTLSGILVNAAGTVIYTSEMPGPAINKRIQRFTFDGSTVTWTHRSNNILGNIRTLNFNVAGTHVSGLDSAGRLYHFAIADLTTPTAAQPAVTFTIGTGMGEISPSASGQPGSFGFTFDPMGRFWVADSGVARIQCFTNTNTAGFLSMINNAPFGVFTTFNIPYTVRTTPDGNILIADTINQRVVVVNYDGGVVKQFGNINTTGVTTPGGFNRPADVATNTFGHFLVTDLLNNRIQRFDSNGTFLETFGSFGSGPGQFNNPMGITTDSFDTMYIADMGNSRIQIWSNRYELRIQTNPVIVWQ